MDITEQGYLDTANFAVPPFLFIGTLKTVRPLKGFTHPRFTYVIHPVGSMAASFGKGSSIAYKRGRSQDSPAPLASLPVPKATKLEDETALDDAGTPAFLRQSQYGKWFSVGAYASMHDATTLGLSTNVSRDSSQV